MKKIFLLICLVLCVCTLSDARTNPYVAGASVTVDATAPTTTACSVAADGVTVTLTYSEPVITTGYDDNDCDLDCSTGGDDITLDTITGIGNSRSFTADTTVVSGETCTLDCTFGANEVEDGTGNDHAGDTDKACTNSSTQSAVASCGTIGCASGDDNADFSGYANAGCMVTIATECYVDNMKMQGFGDTYTVTLGIYAVDGSDRPTGAAIATTAALALPASRSWAADGALTSRATLAVGKYWFGMIASNSAAYYRFVASGTQYYQSGTGTALPTWSTTTSTTRTVDIQAY